MKTRTFILLLSCLSLLGFYSCKDNDGPADITVADASDLVIGSMENGNFGVAKQMEQAAHLFENYLDSSYCGFTGDSTVLKYYGGQAIQYNYTFSYTWLINCAGSALTSVDVNYTGNGTNETSLLTASVNATGTLHVGSVEQVTTEYVIDGSYNRTGQMTSKVRDQNEFDYTIAFVFSQVIMDKDTYLINSGTASVTVTCSRESEDPVVFEGTVTFHGGQSVTLVLGGSTYSFQL